MMLYLKSIKCGLSTNHLAGLVEQVYGGLRSAVCSVGAGKQCWVQRCLLVCSMVDELRKLVQIQS